MYQSESLGQHPGRRTCMVVLVFLAYGAPVLAVRGGSAFS
jgi:hypothetical protein